MQGIYDNGTAMECNTHTTVGQSAIAVKAKVEGQLQGRKFVHSQ